MIVECQMDQQVKSPRAYLVSKAWHNGLNLSVVFSILYKWCAVHLNKVTWVTSNLNLLNLSLETTYLCIHWSSVEFISSLSQFTTMQMTNTTMENPLSQRTGCPVSIHPGWDRSYSLWSLLTNWDILLSSTVNLKGILNFFLILA